LVTGPSEMLTTLATLICAVKAFDPSIRPRCLVTGQATTGWNQINSPQYPKPAPGKLECLYIITAPKGAKIELHFTEFELLAQNNPGCQKQGLALLDPVQTMVPGLTEMYCGKQAPVPFVSRGNSLYLKFESAVKAAVQTKGFLIKYRIKPAKMAQKAAKAAVAPVTTNNNKTPTAPEKQKPSPPKKPTGNRSGGKIMARAGGGARPNPHLKSTKPAAKNIAGRRPSNNNTTEDQLDNSTLSGKSSDTNLTLADSTGNNSILPPSDTVMRQNGPQRANGPERANFHNDVPVAAKKSRELGGKKDIDTKRMLKWLVIGLGSIAGLIVVVVIYRHFSGAGDGGFPEPETKLPEGTIPTHVKALMEHKEKMKSLGKNFKDEEQD